MKNEINVTGAYEHMDDGALEQRYTREAANSPSALRIGVRRAVALGGIAAVGVGAAFAAGLPQKAAEVFGNANDAANNAAAARDVPESQDALIQQAQETVDANRQSNIDAANQP